MLTYEKPCNFRMILSKTSGGLDNPYQQVMPTYQGGALRFSKRSPVVNGGYALLLVCKQGFDDKRLNASIVQPR